MEKRNRRNHPLKESTIKSSPSRWDEDDYLQIDNLYDSCLFYIDGLILLFLVTIHK